MYCTRPRSVSSVVDSRVTERLSDEEIQTASLLQECIMVRVRNGLARLPDVFTVGNMSDIVRYLLIVLSFIMSLCTLCTTDIINTR